MATKSPQATALAELVKRVRLDAGISLKEVERRSGKTISEGHLSRLENGFERNAKASTLRGIHRGLRIPLPVLAAASFGFPLPKEDENRERLVQAYESLPDGHREDLLGIALMLEEAHGVKKAAEESNNLRRSTRSKVA